MIQFLKVTFQHSILTIPLNVTAFRIVHIRYEHLKQTSLYNFEHYISKVILYIKLNEKKLHCTLFCILHLAGK